MLKSITLSNYTTFIQETTLDFSASKYTFLEEENVGADKVLKGALLVGENASGKTNILKALLFLLQAFSGVDFMDFFVMKSFYTMKKDFSIKYVFCVEGNMIDYVVVCDGSGFLEEKLYLNKNEYFDRKGTSAKIWENKTPSKVENIPNGLLFLRKLYFDTGFSNNETLRKWAGFLERSVYINCLDHKIQGNPLAINSILTDRYFDINDTREVNEFLNTIGYRQKVYYSDVVKNPTFVVRNAKKFLSFEKEGTNVRVPMRYESTGNKTLIPTLLAFMYAVKNECMLVVDEFSSGFHNELEECLLKYFFKKSRNSQIFFTTHSTNVLDTRILRPDQIYSVKFEGKRGGMVKRFSEHVPMPRVAQNLEHMYLNGEFDGKPYYNSEF